MEEASGVTPLARLCSLLTTDEGGGGRRGLILWFCLSILCATLFTLRGIDGAFSNKYVIQDDARQHVFWMQRFIDPELFSNDLIADYYRSIAPTGYTAFYRAAAFVGISPISLSKGLPILLGLVATAFCFGFTMQLLRAPFAAFLSSLLLNQALWSRDDIISATARAFLYPLFFAFLYYLARRKFVACLIAITLQAIFYPSIAFISAGVLTLGLIELKGRRAAITADRFAIWICASGLAAIAIALLFYALKSSGWGDAITGSEARQMREFYRGGRVVFFRPSLVAYWLKGNYSGILPGYIPYMLWAGVLFPLLYFFKSRLPLLVRVSTESLVLAKILVSSLFFFFAAHLLLFRLYLPSRYTQHTFRIVLSVAAAITIVVVVDAILRWAAAGESRFFIKPIAAFALIAALFYSLATESRSLPDVPQKRFRVAREPEFYDFLASQPKDVVIASLIEESDNIPSFSARTVLVAREYSLPFHTGYYSRIRERAVDLISAQYSGDLNEVKSFIEKYGIDLFVVSRKAFSRSYVKRNRLIKQFLPEVVKRETVKASALSAVMKEAVVFESKRLLVIDAARIAAMSNR